MMFLIINNNILQIQNKLTSIANKRKSSDINILINNNI